MCRLFESSNRTAYRPVTRRVRLHGHSTSVRLEVGFWTILESIAQDQGLSIARLICRIHDEIRDSGEDITNFASCLRVVALHYESNRSRFAESGDRRKVVSPGFRTDEALYCTTARMYG